jgi:hypothetical protein
MDVRVEAGPLSAGAVIVESKTVVELVSSDVVIVAPTVSRFSLAPVISVGGNSISAVNPQVFKKETMAVA